MIDKKSVNDVILQLESAINGSTPLDIAVHDALGLPMDNREIHYRTLGRLVSDQVPAYTTSFSQAYSLLPSSVTNFHLFSFYGHGRADVEGDCWGCQVHDREQLIGAERAQRKVKRFHRSFEITGQPRVSMEKAIAEQYCDFAATHAATPSLAICIVALKVRIGRTVDDESWVDKS